MHRPFFLSALTALAVLAGGLAAPVVASAQVNVMVLGIRSLEGDDEFSRNLTGALRHAASQVEGWSVSDREVTLAQMALAHGCDEPDPTCMGSIADSLQADRVIYGTVRRTSAGEPFDFSINLHLYNNETHEIEHSVADTIPGMSRDIDDLREPVRRYIAALSGAPRVGTIRVTVNVPGAEVFVDGQSVGVANDQGQLLVPNVVAGSRNVRVVAAGHQSFSTTIPVDAYAESDLEAELEATQGAGGEFPLETVGAASLLALGGVLAAGFIGSMARIYQINHSQTWHNFKAVFQGSSNMCAANRGSGGYVIHQQLGSLCSEGGVDEVLQFVFGVGAAASLGFGAYLLYDALFGEDGDEDAHAWQVVPSFGPNYGFVSVIHSF